MILGSDGRFTSGACLGWMKYGRKKKSVGFRNLGDNFTKFESLPTKSGNLTALSY